MGIGGKKIKKQTKRKINKKKDQPENAKNIY